MSAFRFYTVLAVIFGMIAWMLLLSEPAQAPNNAMPNPAATSVPRDAGIEKFAQAFDR